MTGASPTENERSSAGVESEMDEARLSACFLASLSFAGLATDRLEEPDVETVESEEDEG